jgi:predicted DCC family thiol-disulfide oxidoreductase YuxK
MIPTNKHIILFDGDCLVCNRFVHWIIKKDSKSIFYFTALQSDIGQEIIRDQNIDKAIDSVIYYHDGKSSILSTAVLQIIEQLPYYSWFAILKIIPTFIRDYFYKQFAKRRYFFNKKQCPLPSPEFKKRIL